MVLLFKERSPIPRATRADEADGLYHALNRGNLRADIFRKDADFAAFERILREGLQIHQVKLYSYQLMSNHYHLVLRPLIDGEMSRFMGWMVGLTRCVIMPTITPVGSVMYISSAIKAFRFRTITASSSFADMWSEMPCERTW